VQAGAHRVKRGYLRCASEGTPDLVTPLGWLEVKQPGKKPSEGQQAWHQAWANWGTRVAVVTSPSEAVEVVRGWMRESRVNVTARYGSERP
jgi:hypothetical protein